MSATSWAGSRFGSPAVVSFAQSSPPKIERRTLTDGCTGYTLLSMNTTTIPAAPAIVGLDSDDHNTVCKVTFGESGDRRFRLTEAVRKAARKVCRD